MNEFKYEELLNYVKSIPQFRLMVASESKRSTAVKLLMHLSGINKNEAWEFVDEYYSRMDIKQSNYRIGNEMRLRSDNAFKTQVSR